MRLFHSEGISSVAQEPASTRPPACVIRLFLRAHEKYILHRAISPDPPSLILEKVMKLLHLTPRLLLPVDGRIRPQEGFNVFLTGDLEGTFQLALFVRPSTRTSLEGRYLRSPTREGYWAYPRARGVAKAVFALVSPSPSPQNDPTLYILRDKHPHEEPHEIRDTRDQRATSYKTSHWTSPASPRWRDPLNLRTSA